MILSAQANWVRAKVKRMFLQPISMYERLNEKSVKTNWLRGEGLRRKN